jgi:hypothetical protein
MAGLEDALAYADGNTSRGKAVILVSTKVERTAEKGRE